MTNYEMALSEIEMYKKAHESLSENLTQANKKAQQFKTGRDKFEKMLNKECERGYQMEGKYHDMTKQRDTLIDDLSWYKAKISRLERENEKLRKANSSGWKQKDEIANKLVSDIKCKNNLLSEISQHIGNKPSSSSYKRFRAKLDSIGIKEGE